MKYTSPLPRNAINASDMATGKETVEALVDVKTAAGGILMSLAEDFTVITVSKIDSLILLMPAPTAHVPRT